MIVVLLIVVFVTGCKKRAIVLSEPSGSSMSKYILNEKMDDFDRRKLSQTLDDFLTGKATAAMYSNPKTGNDYALSVQEKVQPYCLRIMIAVMSPKEGNPKEKGSPVMSEALVCLEDNIWKIN